MKKKTIGGIYPNNSLSYILTEEHLTIIPIPDPFLS